MHRRRPKTRMSDRTTRFQNQLGSWCLGLKKVEKSLLEVFLLLHVYEDSRRPSQAKLSFTERDAVRPPKLHVSGHTLNYALY